MEILIFSKSYTHTVRFYLTGPSFLVTMYQVGFVPICHLYEIVVAVLFTSWMGTNKCSSTEVNSVSCQFWRIYCWQSYHF